MEAAECDTQEVVVRGRTAAKGRSSFASSGGPAARELLLLLLLGGWEVR